MGSVGTTTMDILTLGQNATARHAARQQEALMRNQKQQQDAQLEEMRKQGPAPTMVNPDDAAMENRRKNRLNSLRAGLMQTIKTNPSGLTNLETKTSKTKMGE